MVWGGEADCEHEWVDDAKQPTKLGSQGNTNGTYGDKVNAGKVYATTDAPEAGKVCLKCDAWVGSLGLESQVHRYVDNLRDIFREVWRVLTDDGTLWLNLGDSYAGSGRGAGATEMGRIQHSSVGTHGLKPAPKIKGVKPKSLIGVPWRVAFALIDDGWVLRSDIVWHKPNPMPEPVKDRPSRSHEYIFLFAKQTRYYYDWDAIAIPYSEAMLKQMQDGYEGEAVKDYEEAGVQNASNVKKNIIAGARKKSNKWPGIGPQHGKKRQRGENYEDMKVNDKRNKRNRRDVWRIPTAGFKGAHFACVDEKTEVLTSSGWKHRENLTIGESIAAYNVETQQCTWTALQDIATYCVVEQPMVQLKGRGIDQLLTPNHRCVIRRRSGVETVVEASDLKPSHKMLVASEWEEDGDNFPQTLARLIGWYVCEGNAGDKVINIYQSGDINPENCDEIRALLQHEGADYAEYSRQRVYRDREVISVTWRVKGAVANTLLSLCPQKRLPDGFLNWQQSSLEALWDALMKGDGYYREGSRSTFVQKDRVLIDQVQALSFRLGFATTLSRRSEGTFALYKTQSTTRLLKSETTALISERIYSGTIWCPKTQYDTWVARRNGKVFITGNTFPPDLVKLCILAGAAEGDTVLDPFAGSGTTGMVALRHQRNFVGIELSSHYAEIARGRIAGDAPLFNTWKENHGIQNELQDHIGGS